MVLRHGLLVEEGDTRQLLSEPQKDYTRDLLEIRRFRVEERPRPADATPVLEMRGITAGYGAATILHDVSFQIHRKRTVAVVGESGSGKSTAARVITGLLPPSAGEVLYDGQALPARFDRRTTDQLRKLQMIYQMPDTALNPKQRVEMVIGRPLQFYLGLTGAKRRERVRELLDMIELEPDTFIDRLPGELSGGQKQRICIARALAAEPEVILCDEVTSALDPLVAEGILKLLDRLQTEFSLSYMFITHDLATVRAIADEVVVMHRGKVVESGPKSEMFTPPHHDYTDLLLSSVPEMDPDWLDRLLAERAEMARQGRVLKAADN
jgi:peptide/nickel transport system ATP-binding protein